ncbi:MAG: tetratricopeptide (TPR) repeat protein [Cellvibrionaceae bacterium]|jgi:tetratricopeptide (TPR) repeat protein
MVQDIQKYQKSVKLGEQLNAQEKWKEAIGAFRIALSEIKDRPEAYVGLAESCMGLKQYDRAFDCYKLAVRNSDEKVKYLQRITDIQERMGRLIDAARTYMAIGEILFKQQELEDAISNWQRAIRLDADLLGAHQRLALTFQRQENSRAAVREYLAIARILSSRGQNENALKVCAAAARLEPDNPDVPAAIELIQKGAAAFDMPDDDEEEEIAPAEVNRTDEEQNSMFSAVRQIATILESSGGEAKSQIGDLAKDPAENGLALAQEDIANEIFEDEDASSDFSGAGMLKLERDALIGQAIHYQERGDLSKAIACYKKAISGGLDLPAAWYMLGVLHLQNDQEVAAYQAFDKAGQDPRYTEAIRAVLSA